MFCDGDLGGAGGGRYGTLVTMNSPNLPLAVRLAAGVAATAYDEACKLPNQLVGLPMTVASRVLQASMRAQQQVTELALRGDEVFAQFRSVDEDPPWARFDEDASLDADGPLATVLAGPGGPAAEEAPAAEPALPGYDELSLAQLRGKLRTLPAEQLEALLEYEQAHQDRPPFVTMLSNRITTVRSR